MRSRASGDRLERLSTRLSVRMSKEDRAWLEEQGNRVGVDACTYMRMMVRQARGGVVVNHFEPEIEQPASAPADYVEMPATIDGVIEELVSKAEVRRPLEDEEPAPRVMSLRRNQRSSGKAWASR